MDRDKTKNDNISKRMGDFCVFLKEKNFHLAEGHLEEVLKIRQQLDTDVPLIMISCMIVQHLPRPQIVTLLRRFEGDRRRKLRGREVEETGNAAAGLKNENGKKEEEGEEKKEVQKIEAQTPAPLPPRQAWPFLPGVAVLDPPTKTVDVWTAMQMFAASMAKAQQDQSENEPSLKKRK